MSKTTKPQPETQGKHYEVDVRSIRPLQKAGGNIRTDYGDIEELAASIETNGIIVPLRGYRVNDDTKYQWEVIDGHRRLAAAMLLAERGINIRAKIITVDARKYSDEQLIIDMITTNSGKPLNPVEQAEAIRRLSVLGWKTKEIADRFGKKPAFVRNLANLAGAPKRIRDMVSNQTISYSLVLNIFKESADYNDALTKIESAFGMVRTEKKSALPLEDQLNDNVPEKEIKITPAHINKVTNKVDSIKELQMVFKSQIDNPKEISNAELHSFAKRLIENKLTKDTINKLIFNS